MSEEHLVRVQVENGPDGPKFKMMPLQDVPPDYIRTKMIGFGVCYTDLKSLKVSDETRHPEFPDLVRNSIRRVMSVLANVQPMTLDEWEFGFRCDMHAWKEIAIYERIADAFERFTAHLLGNDELTKQKRLNVFSVILSVTNNGLPPDGYALRPPATMTVKRVKEIGEWLISKPVVKLMRERADRMRDLIMPGKLAGPDRVNISAMFGEGTKLNDSSSFSPKELVASADVIIGVDTDSGNEFIVFGRDVVDREPADGEPPLRVLHIELDQDTDELERLVALVLAFKGRHDYRADPE